MTVKRKSPAAEVMNEAIEMAIEGRSTFPDRAVFIDADLPSTQSEIRRAARKGVAAVLVFPDGSTRIMPPEHGAQP